MLHLGMVAAPLVIGEVVMDTEKKWRAMRMIPVLGAIASEALWTMKIVHDRKREEEDHAALEACREQQCR
jgi:ABC-type iron transport system FetAB permease component